MSKTLKLADYMAEVKPAEPFAVELPGGAVIEFPDFFTFEGDKVEDGNRLAAMALGGPALSYEEIAGAWLSEDHAKEWNSANLSLKAKGVIVSKAFEHVLKGVGLGE